jgi:hypothetical protein
MFIEVREYIWADVIASILTEDAVEMTITRNSMEGVLIRVESRKGGISLASAADQEASVNRTLDERYG